MTEYIYIFIFKEGSRVLGPRFEYNDWISLDVTSWLAGEFNWRLQL